MPSNKTKKRQCRIYKSCEHVPCGEVMNRCKPSYCSKGSKNWASCNMANWPNQEYRNLSRYCRDESHCKMSRIRRISTDQVDALELQNKMPYIWRFLDGKTRRKIVRLARKPVSEINIKYMHK